ncbi:MAG: hypothetical protein ACRCRZ_01455 [Metamycoplasmataceae bacterium]
MKRVIFHIDVDSFFVSAEISKRKELEGSDIVICNGDPNSVVSSISYSLKNKGLKVPCKLKEARKISNNLISLKPDFAFYQKQSLDIYKILFNFTNKIEILSIDEWFLDVSEKVLNLNEIKNLAKKIQLKIKDELNLPVSIGISYTCFLAKMATSLEKPFGISIIKNLDEIKEKIWPLEIGQYYGIGRVSYSKLKEKNINYIGQLQNEDLIINQIKPIFKNMTSKIINNIYGIGNDIINYQDNSVKSISKSRVIKKEVVNLKKYIYEIIRECSLDLSVILANKQLIAQKMNLIFYDKNKKYNYIFKNEFISSFEDIYLNAKKMIMNKWDGLQIFKIEIVLGNLYKNKDSLKQENIFTNDNLKNIEYNEREIINKINSIKNQKILILAKEILN